MNLNPLLKSVTLYFALTLNQPPTLIKHQPLSPGSTSPFPMFDMKLSNAVAQLLGQLLAPMLLETMAKGTFRLVGDTLKCW